MKTSSAVEANFDGLVGLTHSYAGLSYGNIASMNHKGAAANPREAALQGLAKAKALSDLGFIQGLLPPQERPDVHVLRTLGFSGTDAQVLTDAAQRAPEILAGCSAASSMWTANAATVSPTADSADGKTHFTAANLNQKLHRSIEHETTSRALKSIFASDKHFVHHSALVGSSALGDEGAANHTRFCREYGEAGVQLFIYGRKALDSSANGPKLFPARQTREASEAVARLHQLNFANTIFAAQDPNAIDAGAFHNDVVSVGNRNVLFFHEKAFADPKSLVEDLKRKMVATCGTEFVPVEVADAKVPLKDAVKSYLFNSQLLSLPGGNSDHMILVAPHECEETPSVKAYLEALTQSGPIREVKFFDLRQSMRNGGGPACLRLRVVLTPDELAQTNKGALMNDSNFTKLKAWVTKHYRDRLSAADLADPKLLIENRTALDELTKLMNLGSIYAFQREGS